MTFKKTRFFSVLFFASFIFSIFVKAQKQVTDTPKVADLAPLKQGDKQLVFPQAPMGYQLVFKGSNAKPVIDSLGKITQPLTSQKVDLYFQLINKEIDSIQYDVSKQIQIDGIYPSQGFNPKPFTIPALREWYGYRGVYKLRPQSRIVISSPKQITLYKLAKMLQKELKEQTHFNLKIAYGNAKKGDILLSLNEKDASIGQEGYYFAINDYITMSATHKKGLFWGTRTLLQLLENKTNIPKGIARDYPEFAVRGLVLDVARKFFTIRFLSDYVKLMSYYKMNDFQIHLNDNGFKTYFGDKWEDTYAAFRLENSTYPKLTATDGFYTKKQFTDLQTLASHYQVKIVPEIDVPAHSLAFSKAVPEIGSQTYGLDHLDLQNPLTYQVIENVFKEYLEGPNPVFSVPEIHIGTDEYAKKEAESFRKFTDHFIKYVQKFGKKVRIWGALTHAHGLTPVTVKNVTLNAWYNGYADPVKMKKLGYKEINTSDQWLYIVPAAGYYYDYLNIQNLYHKWTPLNVGNITFPAGDDTILGASFAVWNDIVGNGISEKDVHDRVFPAMQTLAQKIWGGKNTDKPFAVFDSLRKTIGEGPSLNISGRIAKSNMPVTIDLNFNKNDTRLKTSNTTLVKNNKGYALSFSGKNSYATLPYTEIGYDYTVSFLINPSANNPVNTPIFTSPNAIFKLKQNNGKLGFSRDGYDIDFDYVLTSNIWTWVTITGNNKGTWLYINGELQKKLVDNWLTFDDAKKSKVRKVETLVFPLKDVGHFNGKIARIKIWNRMLSPEEIKPLKN